MLFYKKLAANTLYQIVARIISSGASFLITILIARHFGVSAYGEYAKISAFVTMFYLFADFGFNTVFLQKEDSGRRFRDLFFTRSIVALILILLINIIAFLLPYNSNTHIGFSPFVRIAIALFSVTIFTESALYSCLVIFQREYLYQHLMLATGLGSFATLSLVGVVVFSGLSLLWVFIAFVVGGLVEAIASLHFSKKKLVPIRIDTFFVKELFYETIPVTFMLVFNLIYFRIDTFLLSLFRPSIDVGMYDIAYRIFDFLIALPLFLSNVLYPKLIEREKNNRNVKAILTSYVVSFFCIGIVVAFVFWFLSPLLLSFIKPDFLQALIPLRLLLFALPIFFASSILQWILLAKKKQKYLSFVYLFLTVVNIFSNLIFIPHFGYVASAIITDIGELLVLVLLGWKIATNKT